MRGSSAGGLKVKALAWTARDAGLSPAWHYPFPCLIIHSKEKFISYIYISEWEHLDLNDSRPSGACTCMLSQKWAMHMCIQSKQ